jgi:phospholipid transport system substrate-binding protein
LVSASALAIATDAHAARNADAEQFVQENASAALRTLSDRGMSAAQRRQAFDRLMTQFADMPRIANFVLGRYGQQLRSDPRLRSEWTSTFQEYSIAVYESRLETYGGSAIRVTDSIERVPGRDVIVVSEIQPRGSGRPLPVQWRMLRTDSGAWKVVDVSLILDGNQIWLAQQQQSEFLAVLGRNNGDIRVLIGNLRELTASMRQRILARS